MKRIQNWNGRGTKASLEKALRNSILSDNEYCCKVIKKYCEKIGVDTKTRELEKLIIQRGRTKIVDLFKLKNVEIISPKYKDIIDKFPKTKDFQYVNIMDKIIPMVRGAGPSMRRLVTFRDLLNKLHTPPIHAMKSKSKCPDDCSQKSICHWIRETICVLERVLEEMSKRFMIFQNTIPIICGSLKEGANIGDVDETDILLILDEKKSEDLKKSLFLIKLIRN